jgi:DNA-binding XRE family transcriptional regulator
MGKIERGEHVPTLPLILKIARALKCSSAHLMASTEAKLGEAASSKSEG